MSDHITIVGNLAGEPRHTQTPSGIPITTFRIASSQRRFDRTSEKWIDGETNWFSVSAFRALAVNAAASLHKGERVVVSGRLRIRAWEKGERSGITAEIDAEAIGHDLLWGTSTFERSGTHEEPATSAPTLGGDSGGWHVPGVRAGVGTGTDGDSRPMTQAGHEEGAASVMSPEREDEPVPF